MARAAVASGGGQGGPGRRLLLRGPTTVSQRLLRLRVWALALPLRPRRLGGALLSGLLYVPLCLRVELPHLGSPRGQSLTGTCPWGSGYRKRIGSKSIFQNRPASDLCIPAGQSGSFGARQRLTEFLLKISRLLSNSSPGRLQGTNLLAFSVGKWPLEKK